MMWGMRHTIRLQRFACWVTLTVILLLGILLLLVVSSDAWFTRHMDGTFGFVLEEGHPYTAPVFVGEFGSSKRSHFWIRQLDYMSKRDLEWAYWPLNPKKLINKELKGGTWYTVD